MAPETKIKKRPVGVASDEVAMAKKAKQTGSEVLSKKRKATDDGAPAIPKKSKIPAIDQAVTTEPARLKTASKNTPALAEKLKAMKDAPDIEAKLKLKNAKKRKSSLKASESSDKKEDTALDNGDDDEEIDDQTDALLRGFESDGDDEKDPDEEIEAGQPIPDLDKKTLKKIKKANERAQKGSVSEKPGVIYLGRIPHGFYEPQIKDYFRQFGTITKVRLSRNRRTGKSKHFAFIEFESGEVAEIVAKTMDNYLLFKHILKCKIVPEEQIHESLWKGANKRFKPVPWNRIEGRKLALGATEEVWNKRIEREEKRRLQKAEKMKMMGYEYDSPKLKSAKGISQSYGQQMIMPAYANGENEDIKTITASHTEELNSTDIATAEPSKQKKKSKENISPGAVADATKLDDNSLEASVEPGKVKKGKKAKKANMSTA